jgi:mRNA interferase MazF
MTDLSVGAVVWIAFPFSDQRQTKRAPAVVLSTRRYHEQRPDIIVARITTKLVSRDTFGYVEIADFAACGLDRPSIIKPVIATIDKRQIEAVAGELDEMTLRNLKRTFMRDVFSGLLG